MFGFGILSGLWELLTVPDTEAIALATPPRQRPTTRLGVTLELVWWRRWETDPSVFTLCVRSNDREHIVRGPMPGTFRIWPSGEHCDTVTTHALRWLITGIERGEHADKENKDAEQ